MEQETQGANSRNIKPADLQASSHDPFWNIICAVWLPNANSIILLPDRKPPRRWIEPFSSRTTEQALAAIVAHQLVNLLSQQGSRETAHASRLSATAEFCLARRPVYRVPHRHGPLKQGIPHPLAPNQMRPLQALLALPPRRIHIRAGRPASQRNDVTAASFSNSVRIVQTCMVPPTHNPGLTIICFRSVLTCPGQRFDQVITHVAWQPCP